MILTPFFSRFARGPRLMMSAVNEYHISEKSIKRGSTPKVRRMLVAQKSRLTGLWNIYSKNNSLDRAKGYIMTCPSGISRFFGDRPHTVCLSDERQGRMEKIIGGKSLQETFNILRAFEETPPTVHYRSAPPYCEYLHKQLGLAHDNTLVVKSKLPEHAEHYWKNIPQQYPELNLT